MNEPELVRELSRRTSIPENTTEAVLKAYRELVAEAAGECAVVNDSASPRFVAKQRLVIGNPKDPSLVDELIERAKKHPLGTEFLVSGLLGTVAIALGAHAFTVEAARARLRRQQEKVACAEAETP